MVKGRYSFFFLKLGPSVLSEINLKMSQLPCDLTCGQRDTLCNAGTITSAPPGTFLCPHREAQGCGWELGPPSSCPGHLRDVTRLLLNAWLRMTVTQGLESGSAGL